MPGSIQVSVLDFKELPSSSNSIKVSLGKVEYEAGEKGTFSFPLTNLQDNFIITIQDAQGNPVSHSGVRTMSIIEKGIWDDNFPFEGGGLVHMKLQFILSEEERNRIRSMRESAMKKKQEEIIRSRLRNPQNATNARTLSLRRHEVSDVLSSTSSQDFRRSSSSGDVRNYTFRKAAEAGDRIQEGTFPGQTSPHATGRREEASSTATTEEVEDAKTEASSTDLVNKKNEQYLVGDIPSYVKKTSKGSTSTPLLQETKVNSANNSEIQSQEANVPETLQEGLHQKSLVDNAKTQAPSTDLVKNEKYPVEQIQSCVKKTSEESMFAPLLQETEVNSAKNSEIQSQQADAPERSQEGLRQKSSVEDTETQAPSTDLVKHKPAISKLDKLYLERKVRSFVKKTSEKDTMSTLSLPETKVRPINNHETRSPQADAPKRLQERSAIAEKIKSFSPKVAGEPDKQAPPEKTPRNIRKMISVFESSISQDSGPPSSVKSYRIGNIRSLKPISTRLRNSFSMGDLQKNSPNAANAQEQIGVDNNLAEPSETTTQPKGTAASVLEKPISDSSIETVEITKDSIAETGTKEQPKSTEEEAAVSARAREEHEYTRVHKESITEHADKIKGGFHGEDATKGVCKYFDGENSGSWIFPDEKRRFCVTAEGDRTMGLLTDTVAEGKKHQEETVPSIPESTVKGELFFGTDGIMKQGEALLHTSGDSSPKSSDEEEASAGSLGQAIKIALVVGFGVLVLLFQQRKPGKDKKMEDNRPLKTRRVLMNKRAMEEQI